MTKTLKIKVIGKVQGVGYRKFSKASADTNNITGSSQNLIDGSVEIYAQGEEVNLKKFLSSLKIGPTKAAVQDLEFEEIANKNFNHFEILQ